MQKNDNGTLMISSDTHSIGVYCSVGGKESKTIELENVLDGESKRTRKETREEIANVDLYEHAKTLVNKMRAACTKYATNVEPLGYLTDGTRLKLFQERVKEIRAEIHEHNNPADGTMQPHPVKCDVLVLPIGQILTPEAQAKLYGTVESELREALAMLRAGQVKDLGAWLQHRKNLAALMPNIVQRAVQDALDQLDEQRVRVNKLMKAERTASEAGAMAEVDLVETALVWIGTSQTGVSDPTLPA